MKRSKILLIGIILLLIGCAREEKETVKIPDVQPKEKEVKTAFQPDTVHRVIKNEYYDLAFQEIAQMLEGKIPTDFKRAVFLVEWAYLQGDLDYQDFEGEISSIGRKLQDFIRQKGVGQYQTSGNYALFEYFTKPHQMNDFEPFIYDFEDFYGNFSSDSWMISSMDITAESIQKGVYMKALSDKENIAFCLLELAFAHQHANGHNDFALMCTDLTLKHFPKCMPALMNKFNTLREFGLAYLEKYGRKETPYIVNNYKEFKATEAKIEELGFREMSGEKYAAWVQSMQEEQQKRLSQLK